jgi:hypothetical protein
LWAGLSLSAVGGLEQGGAVAHGDELADGRMGANRRTVRRPGLPQRGDGAVDAGLTAQASWGHRHAEPGGQHDRGRLHGLPEGLAAWGGHHNTDRECHQAEARDPPRVDQPGLGQPVVQGATEYRVRGEVGGKGDGRAGLGDGVGDEGVAGRVGPEGQRNHDRGVPGGDGIVGVGGVALFIV